MENILDNRIQIFQSHWWQLNSILCQENLTTLVWDPGYDQLELEMISKAAGKINSTGHYLIFTHGDFDHIAGETSFKGYNRIGSAAMDAKRNKAEVLLQIENLDHEFYIKRTIPPAFPVLDQKIFPANPSIHKLGNLEVHFYQAAGHTADGLFTIVPEIGLWVAGDYLSDIEFPFVEDQLDHYFDTLTIAREIIADYKIEVMVPGHGRPSYSSEDILSRINHSEDYLVSLTHPDPVPDWKTSWGHSPFFTLLDKMHQKNIDHARSQSL